MKKTLSILFLSFSVTAFAADIASLKELCPVGATVTVSQTYVIDGIVASDYRSQNMELNPNLTHGIVDDEKNDRTAYIQTPDGSIGARLVFKYASDNELRRYDRVSIDIKGCTVSHDDNPDRITISGMDFTSIVKYEHGTAGDISPKIKSISELTDSDLYTLVSIRDVELVFKGSGYTDIYEGYALPTGGYIYEKYYPNSRMDGWASLMRDIDGNTIYMLVNTKCPWRRNGKAVPAGTGNVSGILVHTPMRRYGGDMGRYSIRPMDESDIALSKKKNSPWKILTGWELDGSNGQNLEFETLGTVGGLFKNGKKGDRVVNDTGSSEGFFWTDSDSFIHVDSDFDSPTIADRGSVGNGALMLKGKTSGWFVFNENKKPVEARSIFIEFNAGKIKGTNMALNFSWMEGDSNLDHNFNYPGEWKVQMTLDEGRSWTTLKETATGAEKILLRSHPWWDKVSKYASGKKYTGYDAGLGMQHRSFTIPNTAFGKKAVIIRITPASFKLAAVRSKPYKDVLNPAGTPSPSMKNETWIRFGKILIEYK